MNRVDLLKSRRSDLMNAGTEIRAKIAELVDAESFVELSAYSFSKNEFYGEDAQGEGVVTGFATVEGNPIYVVAQNGKVLSGGISKANCDKICKTLVTAANNNTPVLYVLDTKGVQTGEGVTVLEGIADVLYEMNGLRGVVPQFALVDGECFGAFALIAAACDFTFFTKKACATYASPAVIASTSKLPKTAMEVGGEKSVANNGVAEFVVESLSDVKAKMVALLDLIPVTGSLVLDTDDDLNRTAPALNDKICPECLKTAVFDNGTFVEIGNTYVPEVICGIGRIGGIATGAVIFDGGEKGVALTPAVIDKINNFVTMLSDFELPLVNFVNTLGIAKDYAVSQTTVMRDLSNLIYNLKDMSKLSVVYGKAVGLGYSVFTAKAMGYDYSCATCNASISLFEALEGAHVETTGILPEKEAELVAKYAEENQDPINAAKGGYIDNVIEPQFVRQHLIMALQMVVR